MATKVLLAIRRAYSYLSLMFSYGIPSTTAFPKMDSKMNASNGLLSTINRALDCIQGGTGGTSRMYQSPSACQARMGQVNMLTDCHCSRRDVDTPMEEEMEEGDIWPST